MRIEAAPVGHGVEFRPGVEPGRLPPAFVAATEEGVRAALRQGRYGWPVTDCAVTMTASRYWPRQSRPHQKFDKSISTVAADFRNLAPVVVAAALRQAGTRVCQPIERFDVNLPQFAVERVLALLGRLGAVVHETAVTGGYLEVSGTLPSARVPGVVAALPDLTGGEAVLTTTFDHYAPVTGEEPPSAAPARTRPGRPGGVVPGCTEIDVCVQPGVITQLLLRAVQLLGGWLRSTSVTGEAIDVKAEDEQAFREFVTSEMTSLRKLAYVTCGDWHTAEDAVANALIKLYPRWRKLERPDLYVKTMVYRAAIDETRRPWRRERSAGDAMPDVT